MSGCPDSRAFVAKMGLHTYCYVDSNRPGLYLPLLYLRVTAFPRGRFSVDVVLTIDRSLLTLTPAGLYGFGVAFQCCLVPDHRRSHAPHGLPTASHAANSFYHKESWSPPTRTSLPHSAHLYTLPRSLGFVFSGYERVDGVMYFRYSKKNKNSRRERSARARTKLFCPIPSTRRPRPPLCWGRKPN